MGPKGSKWLQIDPNWSKWVQMSQNGSKYFQIGLTRSTQVQMGPVGLKKRDPGSQDPGFLHVWVQSGENWSKWVEVDPNTSDMS